MTAVERVEAEIVKLDKTLVHRGAFFEDKQVRHQVYTDVRKWIADDKEEADRIELEAMEAAEVEAEEAKRNDPNYHTRELFKHTKITIPTKGK